MIRVNFAAIFIRKIMTFSNVESFMTSRIAVIFMDCNNEVKMHVKLVRRISVTTLY